MAKTLTLYPAYFKKQDSSADGEDNFYRILSSNGTGEAAHKAANNSTVGVIAFDMSPLRGLSTACQITGYGLAYQQRCNINVWAKQYWINSPLKLTNVSITGQTLNSFSEASYGSGFRTDTTGNDYINQSGTFFNTTQDGSGLFENGSAYLAFRLGWHNDQGGNFKTWMRNLRASVTVNQRYYAKFYDENGTLVDTQLTNGGEMPTVPAALEKTGYTITSWRVTEGSGTGNIYSYPVNGWDQDMSYQPIYSLKECEISVSPRLADGVGLSVEKKVDGAWQAVGETDKFLYGDEIRYKASGYANKYLNILGMTSEGAISLQVDGGTGAPVVVYSESVEYGSSVMVGGTSDITFVISTSAGENGSITPTHNAIRGSRDSVTITPDFGFQIKSIEVDGEPYEGAVVFENVSSDHSVEVEFERISYPITFDLDDGVTVTGPASVLYGEDAEFSFGCGNDYSLLSIQIDGGENLLGTVREQVVSGSCELEFVAAPHTIKVTATDEIYEVSVEQPEGGTITPGDFTVPGTFVVGCVLDFYEDSDEGWRLVEWSNGGKKRRSNYTVESDLVVTAEFEYPDYPVTVVIHGDGTVWKSAETVNAGEDVTLRAIPDVGNAFVKWTYKRKSPTPGGAGAPARPITSYEPEITLEDWSVWGDVNVYFETAKHTVTVSATEGNTISQTNIEIPEGETDTGIDNVYWYGTEFDLTAAPGEGFYFVGWSDEPGNKNPERHYIVTHDAAVQAVFRKYTYKQDVETNDGGVAEASEYIAHGDSLVVNITANYGYKIKDVLLDGASAYDSVTLTRRGGTFVLPSVTRAHKIEVVFEKRIYQGHRLLDYYPPVIASIREIEKLMEVLQVTDDQLWDSMSFVMENQFIDSATAEGVTMWERELGIVPSPTDTMAQRKARLRLKWVPNNRFTLKWLHEWLEDVCGTSIQKPVVHVKDDYILTVVLPWFVQWVEVFGDIEKYKPANIQLDPTVQLPSKDINLYMGFAMGIHHEYTVNGHEGG